MPSIRPQIKEFEYKEGSILKHLVDAWVLQKIQYIIICYKLLIVIYYITYGL